ncbi:hypothetical protein F4780DRAFT_740207, partial [Xylariomycetidae sp. FL0641]
MCTEPTNIPRVQIVDPPVPYLVCLVLMKSRAFHYAAYLLITLSLLALRLSTCTPDLRITVEIDVCCRGFQNAQGLASRRTRQPMKGRQPLETGVVLTSSVTRRREAQTQFAVYQWLWPLSSIPILAAFLHIYCPSSVVCSASAHLQIPGLGPAACVGVGGLATG